MLVMVLGAIGGAALLVRKSHMPSDDVTLADKARSITMLAGTGILMGLTVSGVLTVLFSSC